MSTSNQDSKPAHLDVVNEYPQRGDLQQFRLSKVTTFTCDRCGKQKTAKLVAIKHGDWNALVCNGCYGWLLANAAKEVTVSGSEEVIGN